MLTHGHMKTRRDPMQVIRKRVLTFAPAQAIIFLELQRRIGIAGSDRNPIAHWSRSSHAQGALEELILRNLLAAYVRKLPIDLRSSDTEETIPGRLSQDRSRNFGKRRKIGAW
jgi:hypothetical protein